MPDQTQRRIAAYVLGGIVAGGVAIGLMAAIYPYALEAYANVVAAGGVMPSS